MKFLVWRLGPSPIAYRLNAKVNRTVCSANAVPFASCQPWSKCALSSVFASSLVFSHFVWKLTGELVNFNSFHFRGEIQLLCGTWRSPSLSLSRLAQCWALRYQIPLCYVGGAVTASEPATTAPAQLIRYSRQFYCVQYASNTLDLQPEVSHQFGEHNTL